MWQFGVIPILQLKVEELLVKSDLSDYVAGIQLSWKGMTRIKQNIFWTFAYNTALIPVVADLLSPLFGATFRPEFAELALSFSSVTIVSLSLMLKSYMSPA